MFLDSSIENGMKYGILRNYNLQQLEILYGIGEGN